MTQGKSIVFLAVVVIILGVAAGFLYWSNAQKEPLLPSNFSEEGDIPIPPDIQLEDAGLEFPPVDAESPDISDFLEESNAP